MDQLMTIATALALALLLTRIFKKAGINFPDVTVFLITGLILGPYCLGKFNIPGIGFASFEELEHYNFIPTVALGFIAFSIGNEFKLSQLKGIGKQATVIGILQAITAMLIVDFVLLTLIFFGKLPVLTQPVAIILGAIATATAPAATLMVVKQYKAHGELTSLLLPIVALDDAVGLVAFAASFGIAQALLSSSINMISVIVNPAIEIVGSCLLGCIMGTVLSKIEELFYSNSNRLSMTIAFVFLTIALSNISFEIGQVTVSFSSLLVCMMLGTVFCNMCPRSGDIMSRADMWTTPLNTLFFVISGAELELGVFRNSVFVLIGAIYVVTRSVGKYLGSSLSAKITGCGDNVVKYLGLTLLPQAGVAIGMCNQAAALGIQEGKIIRNIILFGIFIYEIFGPSITHWALKRAGDIKETPESKTNHNRFDTPKDYNLHRAEKIKK